MATAVLAVGLALATGAPALAATDAAGVPDGVSLTGDACGTSDGVDVVVDLPAPDGSPDGGEVRLGCAAEVGVTGTEALNAAGFTDTRDAASMICAIDSYPDPCPTEFQGVYWSYWYADTSGDQAGQWQQYMEGSDTVATQAGRIEGWRYGDGSEGPRVDPAALAQDDGTQDAPAATGSAEDGTDGAAADEAAATETEPDASAPVWPWVAGAAVVLALGALLVRARRRPSDPADRA